MKEWCAFNWKASRRARRGPRLSDAAMNLYSCLSSASGKGEQDAKNIVILDPPIRPPVPVRRRQVARRQSISTTLNPILRGSR
jgi:hypothetical protein